MPRLISLVVMAVVLSAGVFSAAEAQEATPTAEVASTAGLTRTDVRYVLPFTGDGLNAELTVTANESGSCVHESLASPGRPDAWGCIGAASNEIFDPCFESPFSTPDDPGELACVSSPFGRDVVLFTPTEPLPRVKDVEVGTGGMDGPPPPGTPKDDMASDDGGSPALLNGSAPLPWALELANGEQCTLATGATAVFAGMRVNYFCPGGSVLGDPDRGLPVWAVTYLPEGAFVSDLVDVAAVWH